MVYKAWILQKTIVGESDIIVTLFLENGKKIQAIAKSALKRDSKLRAHLEPHRFVEVLLTGSTVKPTLAECVTIISPIQYRSRIYAEQYSMILESFGEGIEVGEMLKVMLHALQEMKKSEEIEKIHTQTIHTLFAMAGVEMMLRACVVCGREKSERWYYGPSNGGVTCTMCCNDTENVLPEIMSQSDLRDILWKHGQFFAIKPLKNKMK